MCCRLDITLGAFQTFLINKIDDTREMVIKQTTKSYVRQFATDSRIVKALKGTKR